MKITLKNIGYIDKAELEVSDLTIICGENNTGKTYISYAIYGFLKSWRSIFNNLRFRTSSGLFRQSPGWSVDLKKEYSGRINNVIQQIAKEYSKQLPGIFSANPELFKDSEFSLQMKEDISFLHKQYNQTLRGSLEKSAIATIHKDKSSTVLDVVVADKKSDEIRNFHITSFVLDAIADIVFMPHLPDVFIVSSERTGAAIFRKELDFARTRMLEAIATADARDLSNPFKLAQFSESGYALPIRDNVDFVRQIEDLDRTTSPLLEEVPDILDEFSDILGGSYKVIRGKGLRFAPKGSGKPQLTVAESSSSVRSLLDLGFYLKTKAKKGDILILDEPELNLHPINQRKLARLFAKLVNNGIKIFITTHSDYIIKELNTLIMLHNGGPNSSQVMTQYGYSDKEILDPSRVRVYMTSTVFDESSNARRRPKIHSLRQAIVDPLLGMEIGTFDETINLMNQIQSDLLYGADRG